MKIAVTATGPTPSAEVDGRFGRARWFLVWDTEGGEPEAIDNSSGVDAVSGAGIASAQKVIDAGVTLVLTGRCGPKAMRALEQAGVDVTEGIIGIAGEAILPFVGDAGKGSGT